MNKAITVIKKEIMVLEEIKKELQLQWDFTDANHPALQIHIASRITFVDGALTALNRLLNKLEEQ